MMYKEYKLKGFIVEKGIRKPFTLKVSTPKKVANEDDFACSVHAPLLFKRRKLIYGVDQDQARELSFTFVKALLAGKRIVDEKNNPVELPER